MGMNFENKKFTISDDGTIKRTSDELDIALLNIIRVGEAEDGILAAYNARKKCYNLCKKSVNRSRCYKEYVERIMLDNFPKELVKAVYGEQYLIRGNIWKIFIILSILIGVWLSASGIILFFIFTIIYFIDKVLMSKKIKQLNNRKLWE